jgi:hypothetical protein
MDIKEFMEQFQALKKITDELEADLGIEFPAGFDIQIRATQPALDYAKRRGIPVSHNHIILPIHRAEDLSVGIARLLELLKDLELYDTFLRKLKK